MVMAYVFLLLAIAAEVVATSLLKSTEGFTRLWPTAAVLAGYVVSFVFLSQAVKSIPVGVAYAMWSGLGTAAIVSIGVVFLGEGVSLTKIAGVALVIGGVVLLNVGGAH
jgi:small multidrug resistance pump